MRRRAADSAFVRTNDDRRMRIFPTRVGLRFVQHGVVISELRTSPGPTHSVFDVLAALVGLLSPGGRVAVLGFAGGGMIAPLQALGIPAHLQAVDLDRRTYAVFCRHCPVWAERICWTQTDAVGWLHRQRRRFDLILEDLTVSCGNDIVKPAVSWSVLPDLIRRRLAPGGAAVLNLLLPDSGRWNPELKRIAARYRTARLIRFEDFENRILVAGDALPSARELSARLRATLARLRSRQAERVRVGRADDVR